MGTSGNWYGDQGDVPPEDRGLCPVYRGVPIREVIFAYQNVGGSRGSRIERHRHATRMPPFDRGPDVERRRELGDRGGSDRRQ